MSNESRVVPVELLKNFIEYSVPVSEDSQWFKDKQALRAILAQPAGPMTTPEPIMLTAVAELVEDGDGGLEPSWILEGGTAELFAGMTLLVADNAPELCHEDGSAEVYPHADASEVERLRYERDCARGLANLTKTNYDEAEEDWQKERDTLRAQLAEQDALLREARQFVVNGVELGYITMPGVDTPDPAHDLVPKLDAALSASAETSIPQPIGDARKS